MTINEIKRVVLKNGDILLIPLSDSQAALGQIVMLDLRPKAPLNPLLRVVKGIYDPNDIDLDNIDFTDGLFPPIITGVGAAVKTGLWKKIGNKPVENFSYPKFIQSWYSEKNGEVSIWYLVDETGSRPIGSKLPEEHMQLEYFVVWSPFDVVNRIKTGEIPFPYADLINHNKFTPRE